MVLRWDCGTVILVILWTVTRTPNPITEGRALSINEIGVATEVFQIAYVAITAMILAKKSGRSTPQIIKEKR